VAPEDRDDDPHDHHSSSILGGGTHAHTSKLSWRDMIFGNDGRVRSHFAERGGGG
jgi:hypothetical protein